MKVVFTHPLAKHLVCSSDYSLSLVFTNGERPSNSGAIVCDRRNDFWFHLLFRPDAGYSLKPKLICRCFIIVANAITRARLDHGT